MHGSPAYAVQRRSNASVLTRVNVAFTWVCVRGLPGTRAAHGLLQKLASGACQHGQTLQQDAQDIIAECKGAGSHLLHSLGNLGCAGKHPNNVERDLFRLVQSELPVVCASVLLFFSNWFCVHAWMRVLFW